MGELDALAQIRECVAALATKWRDERIRHIEWLPHQAKLLQSKRMFRLLRSGNQIGKTEVGCSEVLFAALGEHPFRQPTHAAGEYWILCAAWNQSVSIQRKLYSLCPRDRLEPGTECTDAKGFGGRYPSVRVLHASGEWSTIKFKTTGQEAIDLAGATIDGVMFDEPPKSQELFSEVQKRVQAQGGWILLTLTPINRDVTWLRALVESGVVEDIHTRFEQRALIPVGRTEPLRIRDKQGRLHRWDQRFIEWTTSLTAPHEVGQRLHGDWDQRSPGAYFSHVWRPDEHVISLTQLDQERETERARLEALSRLAGERQVPEELGGVIAHIGMDHGHRPGKQYVCLLEIDDSDPRAPSVVLVDEYSDELGLADPRRDARGVLLMLERAGWEWRDLTYAGGDRVHLPGTNMAKSNRDLELAIRAELEAKGILRLNQQLSPRIRTSKKGQGRGKGSVMLGCRWIYRAIADGRFRIASECRRAQAALIKHRMRAQDDEHKDVIDAIRYALDPFIFYRMPAQRVPVAIG